jgi:hypothetical protein
MRAQDEGALVSLQAFSAQLKSSFPAFDVLNDVATGK